MLVKRADELMSDSLNTNEVSLKVQQEKKMQN